jgi:methionine--tRNA ligase beta chain
MITIDDVVKVEIKAGKILSAETIEGSNKLLKLSVDFAEESPRTVLSGIAKFFPEGEGLVGQTCAFVTNLEPRAMMGMESQAMILGFNTDDHFSLLKADESIPAGLSAS